ncbi:MAG: PHP domain-containing protein [Ruminiclostridium sp.]|nr:PHP domain-containing protein [Ruminiclostridium sp.]
MDLIDLHTHTTVSDGSMLPEDLVKYAKSKGLKAIAITDHDTTDGLNGALEESKRIGFEVIPGIEISADFNPEMHILGYFPNGDYVGIAGTLADLRLKREERNPRIVNKLNELGLEITMEEVFEKSSGGVTGRPHIAKVLIEKGYVQSLEEAFDKYLACGRPAYFKKEKLTPRQCIREINAAGGLPVLAHPIYLRMEYEQLDILLEELVKKGLKGIEAYYADNTSRQTRMLLKLAEKHSLLVTGGSDFHGSFKPDIDIGVGRGNLHIPYDLLVNMKMQKGASL